MFRYIIQGYDKNKSKRKFRDLIPSNKIYVLLEIGLFKQRHLSNKYGQTYLNTIYMYHITNALTTSIFEDPRLTLQILSIK